MARLMPCRLQKRSMDWASVSSGCGEFLNINLQTNGCPRLDKCARRESEDAKLHLGGSLFSRPKKCRIVEQSSGTTSRSSIF